MALASHRIGYPTLMMALLATGFFIVSCRSTSNLVLDDPAVRDDMISDALEGKKYNIDANDFGEIQRLFTDENPDYRLAGLFLALRADNSFFHPLIARAALDSDERVSLPALEEIVSQPRKYRQAILSLLNDIDPSLRVEGLRLLARTEGEDSVRILISYFDDPDPNVRNQASLSVRLVARRDNPELQAAVRATDSRTAVIAYRTLGRYLNPNDMPLFIEAFNSSNPELKKEAQIAALHLGEAGLPYLHREATDQSRPYNSRIAAMDVMQGLRSVSSLFVLLTMLNDRDERIRSKAEAMLGDYGSEAIPRLAELYEASSDSKKIRIIELMGDIRSPIALPTLIDALGNPSDEVSAAAMNSIRILGNEARSLLRNLVINAAPPIQYAALTLLREQDDPWLVNLESGSPNQSALLLLITNSNAQEINRYLLAVGISRLQRETIQSLKEAWDVSDEFVALERMMSWSSQPYLRAWRQWQTYSMDARRTLQRSFDEIHKYFDTHDPAALEKARVARAESRRLEELAMAEKTAIENMSIQLKEQGEMSLARYKEIRELLVRTWESVTPELRSVAEELYSSQNLDPVSLTRETTLLE